jgi:hypothetical protein
MGKMTEDEAEDRVEFTLSWMTHNPAWAKEYEAFLIVLGRKEAEPKDD